MKKSFILLVSLLVLGSSLLVFPLEEPKESIEGNWLGVLKVPGAELKVVVKISRKADGTLTAAMDSPDQGAKDIPVEEVIYKDGQLILNVTAVQGKFEGKANPTSQEIEGVWKQGGTTFPLTLKRTGEIPTPNRPQEPKKPYPYDEEEVVYENTSAGVKLAGTLTLPRSKGPFPAVLLITGSGAQDRDETVFGHRPFLVLADYLTRRNIAVLRVDDRGIGGSTGKDTRPTSMDFAEDVMAGVRFLKTRKEIDPNQIGLIGHSEGGLIAPIVASRTPDVAFIVLMAGTGITGDEILIKQIIYSEKAKGKKEEEISKNIEWQKKFFAVLKNEPNEAAAEKKMRILLNKYIEELSEEEKKQIGDPEVFINGSIKNILNPWIRFFLTFDPKTVLVKVKCPVLAINGEKDMQVPAKENLQAIEGALKSGGNKNYTVKELPGLNHLFQTAETGSPLEYAKIEETMSPTVLKLVGDWILAQVRGAGSLTRPCGPS